MERKIAAIHRKTPTPVRQLPITGCAHKAGIVGDQRKAAHRVLAARDVPAERRRAAALDRTHHLQLIEAHMVASRQAGPWSRRMSATSRAGRTTSGGAIAPSDAFDAAGS